MIDIPNDDDDDDDDDDDGITCEIRVWDQKCPLVIDHMAKNMHRIFALMELAGMSFFNKCSQFGVSG